MEEVPEWLMFDQQDVHDTLVATSKHKPHLIADMAAMANVPGLANGHARRPVVLQTQQHASQVRPISLAPKHLCGAHPTPHPPPPPSHLGNHTCWAVKGPVMITNCGCYQDATA